MRKPYTKPPNDHLDYIHKHYTITPDWKAVIEKSTGVVHTKGQLKAGSYYKQLSALRVLHLLIKGELPTDISRRDGRVYIRGQKTGFKWKELTDDQ